MDGSSGERAAEESAELLASSSGDEGLPTARPTPHLSNFLWWLGLIGLAAAALVSEKLYVDSHRDRLVLPGREREAFVALSFGKIAESGEDVIREIGRAHV